MLLKKSLEGAIKTKEKPLNRGAFSRVKPLQSWVRFDYMAYRICSLPSCFTTDTGITENYQS